MDTQPKPIKPHSEFVEMYTVASGRNPKFTYVVALNASGAWSCSCPAWVWGKPREHCKHITRLLEWREKQVNLPIVEIKKPSRFNIEV